MLPIVASSWTSTVPVHAKGNRDIYWVPKPDWHGGGVATPKLPITMSSLSSVHEMCTKIEGERIWISRSVMSPNTWPIMRRHQCIDPLPARPIVNQRDLTRSTAQSNPMNKHQTSRQEMGPKQYLIAWSQILTALVSLALVPSSMAMAWIHNNTGGTT